MAGRYRVCSRSIPITKALAVRSSSRSIRSSANGRAFGLAQNSPIPLEVREEQDVEEFGSRSRPESVEAQAQQTLVFGKARHAESVARTRDRVPWSGLRRV